MLDRWEGRDVDHFRVRGDDGHTYVLKRARATCGDSGEDTWEMVSFTHRDSQRTSPEIPDDTTFLQ